MTATNLGPSPATGVAVTDQLPAGLTFTVTAVPSQGDYDPARGVWTVGSVAASQSAVLSLTALVTQTGGFTNTASKTAGNEPDPNLGNDSGSVTATADRVADLSVTKTDAVDSVVAGLTDTYTITVANAGPSAVTGAPVVDTFPATLTGVAWTCAATDGGSCAAPSGAGDIATTVNLPAGASATFTATGTLAPGATGTLTDPATVETRRKLLRIPTPATTARPTRRRSARPRTSGGRAGVIPARRWRATRPRSRSSSPTRARRPRPAWSSPIAACRGSPSLRSLARVSPSLLPRWPNIAPGASATITATVSIPAPYSVQPIVNAATASSATPDPDPANNVGQASVSVLAPVADLTVGKSDGVTSVVPGSQTTYTITVTNAGPDSVSGVR